MSNQDLGYEVTDQGGGNISIKCTRSGRPYTRSTTLGMFCDAQPCECEQESQRFASLFGSTYFPHST